MTVGPAAVLHAVDGFHNDSDGRLTTTSLDRPLGFFLDVKDQDMAANQLSWQTHENLLPREKQNKAHRDEKK